MLNSPLFSKKKPCQYPHNIADYKIQARLGGGGFGSVELATVNNGSEVVVKRIQKNKESQLSSSSCQASPSGSPSTVRQETQGNEEDFIQREIEAGRRLRHKGIAQFYDHFEDHNNHYFVMEYVKGGDLFTVMDERGFEPLRESDSKRLFRQILRAVQYTHNQGVCHLDLKLENILITTTSSNRIRTKIIDFGLCHLQDGDHHSCGQDKLCKKWAGSPDYCCPEILIRKPYEAEKADVWSLGVILYILLFAELPFSRKERYRCLRQGRHPPIVWPGSTPADASSASADSPCNSPKVPTASSSSTIGVSEAARDLIIQMLQVDPAKRISIDDALKHRFLRRKMDTFSPKLFSAAASSSTNKEARRHQINNKKMVQMLLSSDSFASATSVPGSPAFASAPSSKACSSSSYFQQ